jgi:hypothetical protein
MAKVVDINAERRKNLTALVKHLQARVDSGETLALAIVEVQRGGIVSTIADTDSSGEFYHQLNSGAARLAWLLASHVDDTEEYLEGA